MTDPVVQFALSHRSSGRKRVFFTRADLAAVRECLQGQQGGATTSTSRGTRAGSKQQAAGKGGAAGLSSSGLTKDYVLKNFQLVEKTDGSGRTLLCRRVTRKGSLAVVPVVPLEELSALFRDYHVTGQGHRGKDELYNHVSGCE